jgi:hypothetical protein
MREYVTVFLAGHNYSRVVIFKDADHSEEADDVADCNKKRHAPDGFFNEEET